MNMSTLDVEKVSLQNMPYDGSNVGYSLYSLSGKHRFRQNNYNQDNGTVVSIFLTSDDYAKLVMNPFPIFSNASNSYLSLEEGAIISLRNETSVQISSFAPLPVQIFHPDTLPPFLLSYHLNMHVGYLLLIFSEPVDMSTFTIVGLALQGSRNVRQAPDGKNQYFAFVDDGWNVSSVSEFNRHVRVSLGNVNMNEIKRHIGLAITKESTWLSAYQPFVNDTHGNAISMKAFDTYNGLNAQHYWADTIPPGVDYWEIDMKTAAIVIFFTETIYRDFFNFSGVILTNNAAVNPVYLHVENPINTTTLDHPFIRFQLSPDQMLELQSYDQFCTHNEDCYLILEDGVAIDTSLAQNSYYSYGIATRSYPLQVRRLQPDSIRPQLVAFDMDIQSLKQRVVLTLFFSKIVNVSSFDPQFLVLQSESNLGLHTEYIPFRTFLPSIRVNTTEDSKEIVLMLYNPIVHTLQLFGYLGKASYYTYLACSYHLVHDRIINPGPNQVIDIPQFSALQVNNLQTDRTPPSLLAWALDLERKVLSMNFSRPIDLSTVHTEEAILFSQSQYLPLSTRYVPLTNARVSDGFHSLHTGSRTSFLVLDVSTEDALYLASFTDFCTHLDECYLSFSRSFVGALEDFDSLHGEKSFVPVEAVSFVSCSELHVPARRITVLNVTVGMSTLDLYIAFSVPVRTAQINVTSIGLWVNDSSTVLIHYLSSDSYVVPSDDIVQNVTVHLSYHDHVQLQRIPPLFTTLNTSFVTFQSVDTVVDVYGNNLVDHSIPYGYQGQGMHAFPANYFQEDLVPPTLLSFYAEDDTYTNVTLYFSEAILPLSVQFGGIHAYKRSTGATYSLKNAILVYPIENERYLRSNFITLDLTPVKSMLSGASIFTRQSNAYLYLRREGAVKDGTKGEALNSTSSFVGATSSIKEGATFLSFRLDLAQRSLLLEMPCAINVSTFYPRGFTLVTGQGSYRFDTFESYTVPNPESTASEFSLEMRRHLLEIVYSAEDHLQVLSILSLPDISKTRLTIAEEALTDGMGRLLSRTPSVSLPCVHIVYDSIAPYVILFTLDLNAGTMKLLLSKPIDITTISNLPSQLILTPAQFNDQADELELRIGEARISTASLSYSNTADATNRTNTIILDLNSYPPEASLQIGDEHMTAREEILATLALARSSNNVYLRIPRAGVAYDVSSSYPALAVPAIASEDALLASSLTRDIVPPFLVAYTLNLDARKLVLNFSEAINVSTLAISGFTLAASTTSPSENYTLSSASSYIDASALHRPTNYVTIHLGAKDVNNMMRRARRLVLSPEQTYLSFPAGTFQDLATPANDNEVIFFRYGMPVNQFVEDRVAPVLLSYNLSMQDGSLTMYFDEVVDCTSFDFSRVFFQSKSFLGGLLDQQHQQLDSNNARLYLSNSTRCLGPKRYETFHTMQVSAKDLIRLKASQEIARDAASTYLGMETATFVDVFGNGNDAIGDIDVLRVTGFTADTQSPQILGIAVSQTKVLTVYFDEPIDVTSITFEGQWAFQNNRSYFSDNGAMVFHLTNANSYLYRYNTFRTMVEVDIQRDFEYMYGTSWIFQKEQPPSSSVTIQDRVFFTARSTSCRDMAGNALQEIPFTDALQLGPTIWYWDLNMDAGVISLTYTARSVHPQIELRSINITSLDDIRLSYVFQGAQYNFTRVSDFSLHYQTYQVHLQAHDLNRFKSSGLLSSYSTTNPAALLPSPDVMHFAPRLLLQADFGSTISTDSSDFVPSLYSIAIPSTQPRLIRYFLPDQSPPVCTGFSLDFNSNALRLHFNEAIDVSSLVVPDIVLFSSTEGHMVVFPYATTEAFQGGYMYNNVSLHSADDSDLVLQFTSSAHPFHPLWDSLKRTYLLSGGTLDSLILRDGTVQDTSGNALVGNSETDPYPLVSIVADSTPPTITKFVVDLNSYQLQITFDDIVDVHDYQPGENYGSGVRIYLLPNSTAAVDYLTSTFDGSAQMLFNDADHLLSVGKILLLSNFTLVDYTDTASGTSYRSLTIDLSFLRYDQFRFESLFAQQLYQQNTAVSFYRDLSSSVLAIQRARDWMGNVNTASGGFSVVQATKYYPHSALPVLEAFDYEVQASTVQLTLYFSSMMRIANFSCVDWQLQDAQDESVATDVRFWTTGDCVVITSVDSRIVQFTVASSVVSGTTIGASPTSTWLTTLTSGGVPSYSSRDIYENSLLTRSYSAAVSYSLLPANYKDYLYAYYFGALQPGPRVIQVSLDMNSGATIVAFSKDIDISSFTNISTWGFQFNDAFAGNAKSIVYLSDSDIDPWTLLPVPDTSLSTMKTFGPSFASAVAVSIILSTNNLNRIKRLANNINFAANVRRDLYIYLSEKTLIVDASLQQPLVPLSVRLQRFFSDVINPKLLNVSLDLGTEQLRLQFDEPVGNSTFLISRFYLQPSRSSDHNYDNDNESDGDDDPYFDYDTGYLRFQDSKVQFWSTNLDVVVVNLTRHDANILKNHPAYLAFNASTIFLGAIAGAVTDQAGNFLQPILPTDALPIKGFLPDQVSPYIVAFDLNMNTAPVILTLQFSEPMDVASLNLTCIILQSRFLSTAGVAYRLTGGTILARALFNVTKSLDPVMYSEQVEIALLDSDVNRMKRTGQLIRNKNAAFLRQEGLGTDTAGNLIDPVYDNEALACRVFVNDLIPPIIQFSHLNMHTGELHLIFDEPVILGSVDVTGLTFVSTRPSVHVDDIREAPYYFYRLSAASSVKLSEHALSTLSLLTNASITLSPADTLSENITVVLAAVDLNLIKRRYPLASSTETTFLSVDSRFITDYVGNGIPTTLYRESYAVSAYTIDRVRPNVTSYLLDMNSDPVVVHLSFSECINVLSLQPQLLFLQNFNARRFGQFFNLNTSTIQIGRLTDVTPNNAAISMATGNTQSRIAQQLAPANQEFSAHQCQEVSFFIESADDINTLRDTSIGIDATRSFLTFVEAFVQDHAENAILPQYDGSVVNHVRYAPQNIKSPPYPPLSPNSFIPDTTPPVLTRWLYDNASLTLHLDFSEPVVITNTTQLFVTNTQFLRDLGEEFAEFFQVNPTGGQYFYAQHPPILGLPLFLTQFLQQTGQGDIGWNYSQRSTRVSYRFDRQQDNYCLSFDYVRQLLRTASNGFNQQHGALGPNKDIVLLNISAAVNAEAAMAEVSGIRNRTCTRSIFTGQALGIDFFEWLNVSSWSTDGSNPLGLILASGYTAHDKSLAENYVPGTLGKSQGRNPASDAINNNYQLRSSVSTTLMGYLLAGSPVCGACDSPSEEYIVRNCTYSEDRVCSRCRSCNAGHAYDASITGDFSTASALPGIGYYTMFPCRGFMDAVCAPCRVCPFGSFVSNPCSAEQNTECAKCSSCRDDEFVMQACSLGEDTRCASCQSCDLMNDDNYFNVVKFNNEFNVRNRNNINHQRVNPMKSTRVLEYCFKTSRNAQRNQLWVDTHCCRNAQGKYTTCNAAEPSSTADSTAAQLRRMATEKYRQLQADSIRFDYEELSPISAN
jgi:hypothetical protein